MVDVVVWSWLLWWMLWCGRGGGGGGSVVVVVVVVWWWWWRLWWWWCGRGGGGVVMVVEVVVCWWWINIYLAISHRAVFVPLICGCRPSCRFFLAGFGNLPVQGRFCRNFQLIVLCFFFCREEHVRGDSATPILFVGVVGLPAQHRLVSAPTRHCPASLTPPPP